MNNREPSGSLSEKLNAWKVSPSVPPSFQREVWQRIATREAARGNSLLNHDSSSLGEILVRPVYALAVGLSIGLGIALAHWANESSLRQWRKP